MIEDLHLHHLAPELQRLLAGREIRQVERGEGPFWRLLLGPAEEQILLSLHPRFPFCLPVSEARSLPRTTWRPSAAFSEQLSGFTIQNVEKPGDDRALRITLRRREATRALLVLLKPVAPALALADEEGTVLAALDPGNKNRFEIGQPMTGREAPLREEPAEQALLAFLPGLTPGEWPRRLTGRFRGVNPTLVEEAVALSANPEEEPEAAGFARTLSNLVRTAQAPATKFYLFSRKAMIPGQYELDSRKDFRVSPLPLAGLAGWAAESGPAIAPLLLRWMAYCLMRERFESRRASLAARLAQRRSAARNRVHALEIQLASAENPERWKQQAELVLASLYRFGASYRGPSVRVPDFYREGAPEVEIPLQTDKTLKENADFLFRRYRKTLSAQEALPGLLEAATRAGEEIASLEEGLSLARSFADLDRLEERLGNRGAPGVRHGRALPVAPAGAERFRRLQTLGGCTVLVGRNAAENDRLTFRLASPHDYWFHVTDYAGSHVVMLWGRRSDASMDDLHQAAAVAAWYSGARNQTVVDVRCTRCKHVRKIKGKAGLVSPTNCSTFRVRPALPSAGQGFPAHPETV